MDVGLHPKRVEHLGEERPSGDRHDDVDLIFRVCRIPVCVDRYMAVTVVTALGSPVLFVAIVMPGIFAIDRRVGKAIGPDVRNAVGAFDPPAQSAHIGQAGIALGLASEANQWSAGTARNGFNAANG